MAVSKPEEVKAALCVVSDPATADRDFSLLKVLSDGDFKGSVVIGPGVYGGEPLRQGDRLIGVVALEFPEDKVPILSKASFAPEEPPALEKNDEVFLLGLPGGNEFLGLDEEKAAERLDELTAPEKAQDWA